MNNDEHIHKSQWILRCSAGLLMQCNFGNVGNVGTHVRQLLLNQGPMSVGMKTLQVSLMLVVFTVEPSTLLCVKLSKVPIIKPFPDRQIQDLEACVRRLLDVSE